MAITAAVVLIAVNAMAGPFADYNQGIRSNDVRITGWATGWQDYIRPNPAGGGYCHNNSNQLDSIDNAILGAPTDFTLNGTTKHVLALGHGASITVSFGRAIPYRAGWNFAVFNNSFPSAAPALAERGGGTNYVYYQSGTNLVPVVRGNNFLWCKPAFVDASSDALNWARFPVTYLNTDVLFQATVADNSAHWLSQDATMLDGLAGKMALQYGTPFALAALTNHPNVVNGSVNLDNIRYIRLTDVIGDGSTVDQYGNPIYSPYFDGTQLPALVATPDSSTDGFALRGVAILETPVPTIDAAWMVQPNFLINISGLVSGQAYTLQTSTNLVAGIWSNELHFIAGSTATTLTNDAGNLPRKFYRIGASQ
ncbi:MAG: hypothetical protein WCS70_15650 [Verrucomicrobiota bacterium]